MKFLDNLDKIRTLEMRRHLKNGEMVRELVPVITHGHLLELEEFRREVERGEHPDVSL